VLFNSLSFLAFFALVLTLHRLPFSWRVKKVNLLWASYLFYAAWNPPFVALIALSTVADWFAANAIARAREPWRRRLWLGVSLTLNLGILGFFKYGGFLLQSFVRLTAGLGIAFHPLQLDLVLPLGISFYTFVTLSYTLDVYRRKMKPWDSFLDFALFVTFFPHLVAGPILRAADFLPQCRQPRKPSSAEFGWGMALFLIGLGEKTVLADYLFAPVADKVYGTIATPGGVDCWIGTAAFAGQIFCDFAGYSTCAIGIAQCLGFWLPQNFRFPYAAAGFSDFWHRWHISLSTWLRDYVYIPLGGNREGAPRAYRNLFVTMLLGGLWHGAAWRFVVWGGLHGTYLAGERMAKTLIRPRAWFRSQAFRLMLAIGTQAAVCLAWVFFRAHSLRQALPMLGRMLGAGGAAAAAILSDPQRAGILALVGALLLTHWLLRDSSLERIAELVPWWLRAAVLVLILAAIVKTPASDRAFIYFQF